MVSAIILPARSVPLIVASLSTFKLLLESVPEKLAFPSESIDATAEPEEFCTTREGLTLEEGDASFITRFSEDKGDIIFVLISSIFAIGEMIFWELRVKS